MESKDQMIQITPQEGTEVIRLIHEPVATRKIHEWNPRKYTLESMQAVIDLVEYKGSLERSVLLYNDTGVRVILDDSVQDRPLDTAVYSFVRSDELSNWEGIFGKRFNQKDFADFLKRLDEGELVDRDRLMADVRKLQVMTEIKGEYQYDEDGSVQVMYKESSGREGLMSLPRLLYATLPILNESDYSTTIELELELLRPKAENEKPGIVITCPKLEMYVREALTREVAKLRDALPGYLIIAGSW